MALLRPSLICAKRISISKITANVGSSMNHSKQSLYIPIVQPKLPDLLFLFEKKTLAEEIRISEPPKKPVSPYIQYLKDNCKKYPNLKLTERMKLLRENWLELDPTVKATYYEKFEPESKDYRNKYSQYLASLTDEQKKQIKALRSSRIKEKHQKKTLQVHQKALKEAGKPDHPGGVLTTFYRQNKGKEMNVAEMTNKWRQLPKEEKEYYNRLYSKEINQYRQELALWEKKMVETKSVTSRRK